MNHNHALFTVLHLILSTRAAGAYYIAHLVHHESAALMGHILSVCQSWGMLSSDHPGLGTGSRYILTLYRLTASCLTMTLRS